VKRSKAQKVIRERVARSEQIVAVPHALTRMRERHIDFLDMQRRLRCGKVTKGPYVPSDSLTDELRYDVEAIVDGEWLRVVVELPDDPPGVIVVTVIVVE
jgi:Domain of unknown function (DUF4258)